MNHKRTAQYLFAALIALVVGIVAIVVMTMAMMSMNAPYSRISNKEEEIIYRAAAITGNEDTVEEVSQKVASGEYSLGDYVIRSLTSAEYLSRDIDDKTFAEDLSYILVGEKDDDIIDAIEDDLDDHTRMYSANEQLKNLDRKYAATTSMGRGKGDSFEDCNITKSVGGVDGYTIGIRKVEGSFRSTGNELRTDFFVDGTLYQGSIHIEDESSDEKDFIMAWNTDPTTWLENGEKWVTELLLLPPMNHI